MKSKVMSALFAICMIGASGSALAIKMVECDMDRCNCDGSNCYCPKDACKPVGDEK